MKQKTKYLLAVAGITSGVLGISMTIPAYMQNLYTPAIVGSILLVAGLVLLAISFGD